MSSRKRWSDLFGLSQGGVLAFVVLTLLSMAFYPGGTYRDRTTSGYSFFRNFLSDRHGGFSRRAVSTAILLLLALGAYIAVLELGPSARRSDRGLVLQATSQKLILLILLPGIAYLSAPGARPTGSGASTDGVGT